MGAVYIFVVNPLVAPSTVATSVEILTYMSAGDDFEFQAPLVNSISSVVSPQADLDDDTLQVRKPIANVTSLGLDPRHSAVCIGDHFTSLKQLIMRYSPVANSYVTAASMSGIRSWWFGNHTSVYSTSAVGFDTLSYLASGYVFARGGIRYIIHATGAGGGTSAYYLTSDSAYVTDKVMGASSLYPSTNFNSLSFATKSPSVVSPSNSSGMEILVPYYNRTHSSVITFTSNAEGSLPGGSYSPKTRITRYQGSATTTVAYRAAADDFQMGYFIGFDPQFVSVVP
jgi:hypothetical protein